MALLGQTRVLSFSWIPLVQTELCQSVVECKSVNTSRPGAR